MTTPAPNWVSFDANKTQGLDLLGLRAPVQAISNELLNGLTSVTPKLRYLSVLTWIIWRYAQLRLPNEWSAFAKFAAAQEAVFVMANLLYSRAIGNLVGRDKALAPIDSNKRALPLDRLVQNIAANIYASATRQLKLTFEGDSGLYGLSKERGLPLALAFDKIVGRTAYGSRLVRRRTLERVRRDHLEELAKDISLDSIPPREKTLLINAIMPAKPMDPGESRRLGTFALLLWLTAQTRGPIDEYDVFSAAREPPRNMPSVFRTVLDGWLDYTIRDVLAATHEAVFEAVEAEADGAGYAVHAAPAIDPAAMIRSLDDLKLDRHANPLGRLLGFGGTLEGVIGLLFAHEEEEDVDLRRETWTAAEPEKNPDEIDPDARDPSLPNEEPPPPTQPTSLETLATFRGQLNTFLAELAKPHFAETCDARRLVDALAFPLLLCTRGAEAGWLPAGELGSTAARVVEIMLDRHYGSGKPRGLLWMVQSRYVKLGREDDFRGAVGEGMLWAVLLAALADNPTTSLRGIVRQAAALSAAFGCQELLAVSDADHLSPLIKNLLIKDAEANITERAAKIAGAMTQLTTALTEHWEATYEEQGNGRRLQPAGSILWSRDWGWTIAPNSPAQAYHSGYVNLERAAQNYPEIAQAMEGLVAASQ